MNESSESRQFAVKCGVGKEEVVEDPGCASVFDDIQDVKNTLYSDA